MDGSLAISLAGTVLLVAGMLVACRPGRARRGPHLDKARRLFRLQREQLEAKFVDLAQVAHNRGTPRWLDCSFDNDVTFVRNRRTGQLSAFVAVMVVLPGNSSFDGSNRRPTLSSIFYEDRTVPTIGVVRSATAVFTFTDERWSTDGRAIFNLSPAETADFYQHDLKVVGHEPAAQASAKR